MSLSTAHFATHWTAGPASQQWCPSCLPGPRVSERINAKEVVENRPVGSDLVTTSKSLSVEEQEIYGGRPLAVPVVLADGDSGEAQGGYIHRTGRGVNLKKD